MDAAGESLIADKIGVKIVRPIVERRRPFRERAAKRKNTAVREL